jgi:flavin reductase (DIM6/NTAB) family NADH-FMN oxidoreductase RutF
VQLAPCGLFDQFNHRPPIIGFASIGGKHSLVNAGATGSFVWNLASSR